MDIITKFAEGFMRLFQTGAETFISWMTGIVPVVLMLMVAMNTLIAFLGEDRVTKVAKLSAKIRLLVTLCYRSYLLLCWEILCHLQWLVSFQNTTNQAIMLLKLNFVIRAMVYSPY